MSTDQIFRKEIAIKKQQISIDHAARLFVAGSCFVDHIGKNLQHFGFNTDHPFGTLYNPITIAKHFIYIVIYCKCTMHSRFDIYNEPYSWGVSS